MLGLSKAQNQAERITESETIGIWGGFYLFSYLRMHTIIPHVAHKSMKIVDKGASNLCDGGWPASHNPTDDDKWGGRRTESG